MKAPSISPTTLAILAAAGVAAIVIMRWGDKLGEGAKAVAQGVGEAASATVDMAGGVLTGNNVITRGARTNAYEDAGVLGTLGAATDRVLGGVPSQVGEWLGGKLFDWTH